MENFFVYLRTRERSHPPKLLSERRHRCVSNARLPCPIRGNTRRLSRDRKIPGRIRDNSPRSRAPARVDVGKVNLPESVLTAVPIAQFGMNQVREQLYAIYDPRAGPGEVGVGVYGENAVI